MRIHEICQNCRYAKISQLLEAGQFCRYVGDTSGFEPDRNPVLGNLMLADRLAMANIVKTER